MNVTVGRKRTGQIKEIGENRFYLCFQTGTGQGRDSYHETFEGSKEEARKHLDACIQKFAELEKHPERAQTVAQLAAEYLARRAPIKCKAKTLLNYQDMLRRYIEPNIGKIPLCDIRATAIREFYNSLILGNCTLCYLDKGSPKHRPGNPVTAHVVNKIHNIFKPAFDYAVEKEYLPISPMHSVKSHKVKKTKFIVPALEERELLFAACKDQVEKTLFMFAYYTAARPEEYLAAEWKDIDLNKGEWKIERALVEMPGGKQNWLIEDLKTESSRRTQPLLPGLIDQLRALRKIQLERQMKLGPFWSGKDLIFGTYDGDYQQHTNVSRQFKALLRRAGLSEKIRLYDLRHAYATHLLELGASETDISKLLGHSSIRVTSDTYLHVSQRRKQSVVQLLEKAG